ncbi:MULTISPECIES: ABC transporter permease [unclassified Rhizobium]|jgi:peptide/nickel transport system permease protein|uniref:ABC transporter permease n=1 Tax=unclassified Rhizobium TaxID=2613769 RepID=UPI000647882F|nr:MULTISPECIES: ABC transporter permease [unclassified Rhizobium]MBN8952430.1 ABC transporter permease [Rhizobium tropici]OJY78914.1 MAG: ABC transporter permease [Rhizobium sp. 60-20]RKD67630.1 peptide/nickel transport system permease protein [Rhizobium sp. WW_1]
MLQSILRAFLRALVTLFLAMTFTFVILRVSGDPLHSLLPIETPPEVVALMRQQWGLDQPLYIQYFAYLGHLLRGDFGTSLLNGQDALALVLSKVPATLELMGAALILAFGAGVPLGILAARNRGGLIDRFVMALAVLMHSLPNFLIAILLIQLFAVTLRILPSGGGATMAHLVMPVLVIGLYNAGIIARFVRSSVLEVLGQRYILAARAKRIGESALLWRHIMPNAALPLLTMLGFLVGGMIGGAAVVESVYAWPGVGRFLVSSVAQRDLNVVQTIVLLITATMVAANLMIDCLYILADPRLRHRTTA